MRYIYLSRHGESLYNKEDRIGGDSDLSDNGYRYSTILSDHINLLDIHVVLTSRMIRTINTAKYIRHPKINMGELNEIDSGICENLTYAEIQTNYPEIYTERNNDKYNYRYPNGESYNDLLIRLKPIFDILNTTKQPILIIAHQAIIRVIYGVLMNVIKEEIPLLAIPLHTLIRLDISEICISSNIISLM